MAPGASCCSAALKWLQELDLIPEWQMVDASALLGTWRMISWTKTTVATGETTDAMGSNPEGYIAYHADGRMMALVVNSRRGGLKGSTPSDE